MKKQIKLREYQTNPTILTISKLEAGKKVILNGCPGSGKTEMAIYIIKRYLDSGKKVLVLAHSTNVLKNNFQDRWNDYYDNHPNLTICIPQSYKKDSYDLAIVDEAHENYLAKVVQDIVKDIPAQLLLTGTPSPLILKGGFDIEVIAMEDVPRDFFAKTGIELLSTCYKWTETDYNQSGNLKYNTSITKSDTESSLDAIIVKLIDRLRNKSVSAEKFNKPSILARIKSAIFKGSNLGKTMFVCSRKSQADYVNAYLIKKGYNSKVSHSDSDGDSVLFDSFKNGDFDVLVVVNRGRLGFSDDNLMNIIDMSGTKNPNLIYQMFARCVRGNQSQNKLFMKLAPTGEAMIDLTAVATQMALSLMFKDVISVFNGKNMNGMFIPVFKSNSETKKSKSRSKSKVSEKNNRVIFPQYTSDVLVELKNIRYSLNDELSIYKRGEIGEIIRNISGGYFPMGYWTKDRCKEVTDKYTVLMEFRNNESACHAACRANGWLDELCDHMSVKYKPSGYWTIENVAKFIDDSKIEVRQDLKKFKPSLFNSCIKKGWMDELFKNKPNKGLKIKVKDVTKDQAYEKSILCKTRRDFSVSFPLEYKASFRNGWLDEFIPFTPGQQGIGRKPTHKGPNGKFIKKD